MADFVEDATIQVRLTRRIPGPGHRFPEADVRLTSTPTEVTGAQANAIVDALPHTMVGTDDVAFEVVDEGAGGLEEVVGASTASNLESEGIETLQDAKEATDEALDAVKGVGSATITKIREA